MRRLNEERESEIDRDRKREVSERYDQTMSDKAAYILAYTAIRHPAARPAVLIKIICREARLLYILSYLRSFFSLSSFTVYHVWWNCVYHWTADRNLSAWSRKGLLSSTMICYLLLTNNKMQRNRLMVTCFVFFFISFTFALLSKQCKYD